MARYTAERLVKGASFERSSAGSGVLFDGVVLDGEAERPHLRDVAVAPYKVAVAIAHTLNQGVFDAKAHR